jgi:hypothetical protein
MADRDKSHKKPGACEFCGERAPGALLHEAGAGGPLSVCEFCLRAFLKRLSQSRFEHPGGARCALCGNDRGVVEGTGGKALCRGCLELLRPRLAPSPIGGKPIGGDSAGETPPPFWFDRESQERHSLFREGEIRERRGRKALAPQASCTLCGETEGFRFDQDSRGPSLFALCPSCLETACAAARRSKRPARRPGARCSLCGAAHGADSPVISLPEPTGLFSLCRGCLEKLHHDLEEAPEGQKGFLISLRPPERAGLRFRLLRAKLGDSVLYSAYEGEPPGGFPDEAPAPEVAGPADHPCAPPAGAGARSFFLPLGGAPPEGRGGPEGPEGVPGPRPPRVRDVRLTVKRLFKAAGPRGARAPLGAGGGECFFCRGSRPESRDSRFTLTVMNRRGASGCSAGWSVCLGCLEEAARLMREGGRTIPADLAGERCSFCDSPVPAGRRAVIGPFPERRVLCSACAEFLLFLYQCGQDPDGSG